VKLLILNIYLSQVDFRYFSSRPACIQDEIHNKLPVPT